MRKGYCILLCIAIYSCQPQYAPEITLSESTSNKIELLKNNAEKSEFLHELWKSDQALRQGQDVDTIQKYGYRSDEHIAFMKKMMDENSMLLAQLAYYLEVHGYPTEPNQFHALALNAFPTIAGHEPAYERKEPFLKPLYQAYLKGHCALDDVVWLLGEMHESKHGGRRYKMKGDRFRTEDEFKELTEALGIDLEALARD